MSNNRRQENGENEDDVVHLFTCSATRFGSSVTGRARASPSSLGATSSNPVVIADDEDVIIVISDDEEDSFAPLHPYLPPAPPDPQDIPEQEIIPLTTMEGDLPPPESESSPMESTLPRGEDIAAAIDVGFPARNMKREEDTSPSTTAATFNTTSEGDLHPPEGTFPQDQDIPAQHLRQEGETVPSMTFTTIEGDLTPQP